MKKRIFFALVILFTACILFRGAVFRHVVVYKPTGQRAGHVVINDQLTWYIEENRTIKDSTDVKEVVRYSLSLTSDALDFTFSSNSGDPNKLIESKTANCIGYAAFFSAVCNHLLKKYHLSGQWTATPEIGQLHIFGINIHQYFHSPFFRDHDFVVIRNKITKEVLAVDPAINDYLYIDFITFRDNSPSER